MTLIGPAPARSMTRVVSPPELFFGFVVSRPVVVARRPSLASARPAAGIVIGVGRTPVPRLRTAPFDGRISSWPYGAASFPVTSRSVPRANVGPSAGRWTTRPASPEAIPSNAGVPRRPASATTTPGRPNGRPDRQRPDRREGDGGRRGRRDRRRGRSWCRGRTRGPARDRRRGRRRTGGRQRRRRGRRAGCRGRCRRVGVGVARTTSSSPGSVAWIRYPAVPVPELSRWPSGPATATVIPDVSVRPPSAAGPTTTRISPDPSSTVMPVPSDRLSGESAMTPWTWTRTPSSGSPAATACTSRAVGSASFEPIAMAASATRTMRCENRLSRVPSQGDGRARHVVARRHRVEIDRDPAGRVLDEPAPARLEGSEVRRQHAGDRRLRTVGEAASLGDRHRRGGRRRCGRWGRRWDRRGRGRRRRGPGVGVGVAGRWRRRRRRSRCWRRSRGGRGRRGRRRRRRRRRCRCRRRCRSRRRRGSRRRRRRRRRHGCRTGHGHRRCRETLRRGRRLHEPVGCIVVRVAAVPQCAARQALQARSSGRRRRGRSLDESIRRVAPPDRIDRRSADDPQRHRAARRREPARVRQVRHGSVDARGVGDEDPPTRVERGRRGPRRLARHRRTAGRRIDDLQAGQVDRRAALVGDLHELVGCRRATGLDLRDHERGWRPPDGRRERAGTAPAAKDADHHDDDERGRSRAPGTIHR